MELPKGHDLRAQLNVIKVEMTQMLESVRECAWDKMTEKDFRTRMEAMETKAWVAERACEKWPGESIENASSASQSCGEATCSCCLD